MGYGSDTFEYEDLPISSIEILPYHGQGFVFRWELNDSFSAPPPYAFVVQASPTPSPEGPWKSLSDPIVDRYYWADSRKLAGKTDAVNFRIVMVDGAGTSYASEPVLPCGDLSLSEFLTAREILRKEELNARRFSGVRGQLWISAEYGSPCQICRDPITGQVRDSHCSQCHGTGFYPSHYGPFDMWMQFSQKQNHGAKHDQVGGTRDDLQFTVRAVGTPRIKKNDVVRDTATGKMYYVQSVTNAAEVRRIPIVQTLVVSEAATSDQCYDIVTREES